MTKKQQSAMQKGRERQIRAARKSSIDRVRNYRAWLKRDVEISTLIQRGEPAKRERMPVIPSDHDYDVARADGAI